MNDSKLRAILSCWSLRRNARALFVVPPQRVPVYDFFRALSILWITGFHAVWLAPYILGKHLNPWDVPWYLNQGLQHADLGVDAFFVLSGMLIGSLLLTKYSSGAEHSSRPSGAEWATNRSIAFGRFYWGRVFRLVPVYYLLVGVWIVTGGPNADTGWASFLFVNNFIPVERQILPTAWSLAIEVQFYVLAPWLMALILRLRDGAALTAVALLFASSFAIRGVVLSLSGLEPIGMHHYFSMSLDSIEPILRYHDTFYDKPYTRFGSIAAGLLGGIASVRHGERLRAWFARPGRSVAILLLCALGVAWVFAGKPSALYFVVYRGVFGACVTAFILLLLHGDEGWFLRGARRIARMHVWFPLAELSYSAYLVQLMVIGGFYQGLAQTADVDLPALVERSFVPIIVATFSAATVLYFLVERPARELYAHFLGHRRAVPTGRG